MVMTTKNNLRFKIAAFFGYNDDSITYGILPDALRYVERFGTPQEAIRYLAALAMTIGDCTFSEHVKE